MHDNLLLLNSTLKYFETEQCAIAVADDEFKLIWFNKQFRNLFKNKRLKGSSLFKLFGISEFLKFDNSGIYSLPIPSLNSTLKIVSIQEKKKIPEKYIIKLEPFEINRIKIIDDEILQNNLLFQKELQNILSLLLKKNP